MTSLTSPHLDSSLTQTRAARSDIGKSAYRPVVCACALFAADCLVMAILMAAVSWRTAIPSPLPVGGPPIRLDLLIPFAIIVLYLAVKGRYREPIPFWTEARLVVCATLWALAAKAALGALTNDAPTDAALIALLTFPFLAIAANRFAKYALSLADLWTLPVVVIGDRAGAVQAALTSDRSLGYQFVGWVAPETVLAAPAGRRLRPILDSYNARRLLIAVDGDHQRPMIENALRERVPFALVPPDGFPAFPFERSSFFSHNITLLSFQDGLSRPFARLTKVIFDVSFAAVILVLTSPLFLILMLLNRLGGNPTFFAHRRVGARGQPFYCLKFRTMAVDADRVLAETLARDPELAAEWATTHKLVNDPRVTRVGHFLRKTSLDELPQLVNVLRLDMSLVGPRPIVESEIPLYGEDIAQYYSIRPGLTGLWQVSGRSNISYARRVQLDVWYVTNWTIWHDIVVLLKTIPAVLGRHGAC